MSDFDQTAQASTTKTGIDDIPVTSDQRAGIEQRIEKLKKMPVTISVRLAEKRIVMEQLLSISPGALLTFNKSCEDLLDLYVNNVLYCRGEAVKIGEKFGLKINDLRPVDQHEPSVLYS